MQPMGGAGQREQRLVDCLRQSLGVDVWSVRVKIDEYEEVGGTGQLTRLKAFDHLLTYLPSGDK